MLPGFRMHIGLKCDHTDTKILYFRTRRFRLMCIFVFWLSYWSVANLNGHYHCVLMVFTKGSLTRICLGPDWLCRSKIIDRTLCCNPFNSS